MAIVTDGPLLEPETKGIDEFHVGLGARLGASAAQTWEDSPVHQLLGISEMEQAGGNMPDFGEISSGFPTGPQIADADKPAVPRMDIIEANDRVKKAGLAPHLKLPDQPDIAPAQLTIMMDRARRRHELDTTVERGPQGFIPGALDVGTSFLVGAVDPLNLASAFVPVMGELRYGKLLADAGSSALSRAAVRTGVGAAQGAAGQALLEPLDWYSHTQDGRDFGMSDVLHNILFGAVLGGGLQAGGGAIADIYRGRKGRPLYPYGPGEPLEGTPQRVPLGPERVPEPAAAGTPTLAAPDAAAPERAPAPAEAAPEALSEPAPAPSPEVQTINDLPAQAHEDAVRGAISDLINGVPVRAGEMLEAASRADPRIAESFEAHGRNTEISASGARAAVFDDIHGKLLAAGMPADEAAANAALVAARYAARAERLGGVENAVDLYRSENISIGAGEAAPEGRAFNQAAPQAPPFYSAVDRAVTSARQDKASPEQWLGTLKNAAGVKGEEMKWLGLDDWLKQQKGSVSKSQLQEYVRANAIEVKEVAKGTGGPKPKISDADAILDWAENTAPDRLASAQDTIGAFEGGAQSGRETAEALEGLGVPDQLLAPFRDYAGGEGGPKFPFYVLPGGENYRELLLTLPEQKHTSSYAAAQARFRELDRKFTSTGLTDLEAVERKRLRDEVDAAQRGEDVFRGNHWAEPNVLAHIRFDDRISGDKKTLHLAEVQSDWHQAGKRKGYREEYKGRPINDIDRDLDALQEEHGARGEISADDPWANAEDLKAKYDALMAERFKAQDARDGWGGVPDAPFKTTWPELSMKRMIRYAAEHGYDRVSWDTGATNAERYDLSKQVDRVTYSPETQHLRAYKNGEVVVRQTVPPEKLEDHIGKDAAKKLLETQIAKDAAFKGATVENVHSLEGLDLKVGGEGMAGFYDKILPAAVNKLVKKFGAKVEEGTVAADKEGWHLTPPDQTVSGKWMVKSSDYNSKGLQFDSEAEARAALAERIGSEPVHALDLTPELRQAAMEQGFPLFQGGGDNPRGRITLADNRAIIDLYKSADRSTFMHESGHLWLDELMRDAAHADAPDALKADRDTVLNWLGVKDASEIATAQHEQWAEGFEQYLKTGQAPSSALAKAFEQFKAWITDIYRALARTGQEISPEIKGVMDRLLATDAEISDRADELGAVTRKVTKVPRGRAAADTQTWSLFEYLASKGGLKPDPELEAVFGGKRGPMIGGFGPLLRRGGMALDEALRVAKEGHYLFDAADVTGAEARLTPRDLLDTIDRESRGQRVYRNDHVSPDREISPDEEARHIVNALHDELEAASGQKGFELDPAIEKRVVEIIQKEGGHDVLAAHERAIMEDEERYNAVSEARRSDPRDATIPGWDVADDGGAAPPPGGAVARNGGAAGLAAAGQGGNVGSQPRPDRAGAGAPGQAALDRRGVPSVLDKDAAWRALSRAAPEFDSPEIVAASKAADAVPAPPSKLQERLAASEKVDAFAQQMIEMFGHRLPEQDRVRLDDLIKRIDDDHEAREIAIVRGGSCLFGVV